MSWEYEYDTANDETIIRWVGDSSTKSQTANGRITRFYNGIPKEEAGREAVAEMIQNAGTPERIRMQFDLQFGFEER